MNPPSTLLIFGVPAMVGFILVLAALWGFLACKAGRQRRKRKAVDKEAKGRGPLALPVTASQGSWGTLYHLPPALPRCILVETGSSTSTWAPQASWGISRRLSTPRVMVSCVPWEHTPAPESQCNPLNWPSLCWVSPCLHLFKTPTGIVPSSQGTCTAKLSVPLAQ